MPAVEGSWPRGYPANDYYDFDYRLSKTPNWTKTPLRRFVYHALSLLGRRRIDSLAVPTLLEWSQHLFILFAATGLVCVHLGIALTRYTGHDRQEARWSGRRLRGVVPPHVGPWLSPSTHSHQTLVRRHVQSHSGQITVAPPDTAQLAAELIDRCAIVIYLTTLDTLEETTAY